MFTDFSINTIMSRNKRKLRIKKKSDTNSNVDHGAERAVSQTTPPPMQGRRERTPPHTLDLTVTYDYSCATSKQDNPVRSMEELSQLFSFKDGSIRSAVSPPVARFRKDHSLSPPPKKQRVLSSSVQNPGVYCLNSLVSTLKCRLNEPTSPASTERAPLVEASGVETDSSRSRIRNFFSGEDKCEVTGLEGENSSRSSTCEIGEQDEEFWTQAAQKISLESGDYSSSVECWDRDEGSESDLFFQELLESDGMDASPVGPGATLGPNANSSTLNKGGCTPHEIEMKHLNAIMLRSQRKQKK